MSTFSGEISEIPGISVDRFDGSNIKSTLYFLSHCHTDHMNGLGDHFFQTLTENDKYFYCSKISKSLLLGIYKNIPENKIIVLEHAIPKTIDYYTTTSEIKLKNSLTVTTSPAGHCPGSVMFIFNKDEKTILYTGDFRLNIKDLPKLNPLNNNVDGKNVPKKFDTIYLDTTFLSLDYQCFPTRKESNENIFKAVKNWLDKDVKNIVILECSSHYGPEYLFIELYKLLRMKIHVKTVVYSNYMRIAELSDCVTNDGSIAKIHACTSKLIRDEVRCRFDVRSENILTIVPSALRWKGKNLKKFIEYDSANARRLYVCQSMHASYQELKSFVDYFKPNKIIACVCPYESRNEIYELIDKFQHYKNERSDHIDDEEVCENFQLTLPVSNNISNKKFKSKYFNDDDDEIDNDC